MTSIGFVGNRGALGGLGTALLPLPQIASGKPVRRGNFLWLPRIFQDDPSAWRTELRTSSAESTASLRRSDRACARSCW
jgi:hypothetical protein